MQKHIFYWEILYIFKGLVCPLLCSFSGVYTHENEHGLHENGPPSKGDSDYIGRPLFFSGVYVSFLEGCSNVDSDWDGGGRNSKKKNLLTVNYWP